MENNESRSRYPKLERPVFESTIPPHLLARLDDKERYLLEQVTTLGSKADWLVERALELNTIALETDARLTKVEDWKSTVTSKGAVVVGIAVLIFSGFASAGARMALEYITKHSP